MQPFILDERLDDFEFRWLPTIKAHILQLDKDFKNIYAITFGTPDEVRAARAALSAEELKRVEAMAMCTLQACMAPTLNLRLRWASEPEINAPDRLVAWLGRMYNGSAPGAPVSQDTLMRRLQLDWTHFTGNGGGGGGGEFDLDGYLDACMAAYFRVNYANEEAWPPVSRSRLIAAMMAGLPRDFRRFSQIVALRDAENINVPNLIAGLKTAHSDLINDAAEGNVSVYGVDSGGHGGGGGYGGGGYGGGYGGGGRRRGRGRGRGRGGQQQRIGIKFENYQ